MMFKHNFSDTRDFVKIEKKLYFREGHHKFIKAAPKDNLLF